MSADLTRDIGEAIWLINGKRYDDARAALETLLGVVHESQTPPPPQPLVFQARPGYRFDAAVGAIAKIVEYIEAPAGILILPSDEPGFSG